MELSARQARYEAIEDYRKRPLIVYATSTRPNVGGNMAGDAIREFVDQIDAIQQDAKTVDVLIHSTGGDALAAWKLMSLLRERFEKVGVLVPFMAFSAATMFAMGADEIVMHPHASLGPIDPQIHMPQADGSIRRFAYEDVGAFLRFLVSEVKITEQAQTSAVIEKLFTVVDPVNVGAAKRASELAFSIGERLLLTHMTAGEDKAKAKQIAENLNKSFFAHGDAVSRRRAKEIAPKDRKRGHAAGKIDLGCLHRP
jgi:Serine dehydrogenase proteinase